MGFDTKKVQFPSSQIIFLTNQQLQQKDSFSFLITLKSPGIESQWPGLGHMPNPEPITQPREGSTVTG